jgi:EAL domain-containing protein (putative c-di-GMP-specific phosphodiesterase class I)
VTKVLPIEVPVDLAGEPDQTEPTWAIPANLSTAPPLSPVRRLIEHREVAIVFQPVVTLKTHQVFAYEALCRPKAKEFKSPVDLFDAAVEEKVVGELGRLLRQMSIDNCSGRLFLNVHPAELNQPYLVQGDDPIHVHSNEVFLELTESSPVHRHSVPLHVLDELRGRGVHIVVDDLGAGYSNLRYIADLHPRVVKLDRLLVSGLSQGTRLFKLVSAVVVLCHELGCKVVAEGIETRNELAAVVAAGADYGQGYLLAKPAFPLPPITWPDGV